jgi:eukaryotic-like serine/threonine-protein kinase
MPEPTVFNGRYELLRRLGRGGMAEVFLARDLQLDRPVAVKVLFPEFANDPAFVTRFRREAQAAANLNHPNIVSVYDWGQEHGTYFIVMEYVDGRTLAEILRADGPLPPERAVDVATDVAAALGAAHAAGVLHRDIKPGNILVAPSGRVKVADWGIGRAMDAAAEENLTQTGAVMGTATYFSPEQAQGLSLDPRSDLYSLGVVLYESLTGTPPFQGDNPVAIAYKHVQEQPRPPRSLNMAVPLELEAIVLQLLAKDPNQRYASADALRDDLRRYREGMPVEASTAMLGAVAPAPVAATQAIPATVAAAPVAAYSDGTRLVPVEELPRQYAPPPEKRSWAFLIVLLVLLAVLAGLLFLLARTLGVGEDDTETVAQVDVPDVVNSLFTDAETLLEAAGFDVERVDEEVTEPAQVDRVIRQSPEGGIRVEEGSEIELVVGTQNLLEMPDLTGSTPDLAQQTLTSLGFTGAISQTEEDSDEVEEGQIIRTEPEGGTEVASNAPITLFVSSGPPQAPVPELSGCDVNAALATLSEAGFTPQQRETPSNDVEEGCIVGTDPPAGTELDDGATVFVVTSSGPATETVPPVVGLDQAAAEQALADAGFDVAVQSRPAEGNETPGTVVDQDPGGNAEAEPGSTVTITVAEESDEGPPPDVGD